MGNNRGDDYKRLSRERAFKNADFYNVFQASTAWHHGFDAGWAASQEMARQLEDRVFAETWGIEDVPEDSQGR